MNKQRITEVFEELLNEWEIAEGLVIHDRGCSLDNEYEQLDKDKQNYRKRFYEALES